MKYHIEMSLQEWLDALVAKRLEMTAKCADENSICYYLDDVTGNKCLIGYFIPDKHPAQSIRGDVEKVMNMFPDLFSCTDRYVKKFIDFLTTVQQILHDHNDATKFSDKEYVLDLCTREVSNLCAVYNLTVPECLVEYKQKVERENPTTPSKI